MAPHLGSPVLPLLPFLAPLPGHPAVGPFAVSQSGRAIGFSAPLSAFPAPRLCRSHCSPLNPPLAFEILAAVRSPAQSGESQSYRADVGPAAPLAAGMAIRWGAWTRLRRIRPTLTAGAGRSSPSAPCRARWRLSPSSWAAYARARYPASPQTECGFGVASRDLTSWSGLVQTRLLAARPRWS